MGINDFFGDKYEDEHPTDQYVELALNTTAQMQEQAGRVIDADTSMQVKAEQR